MFVSYAQNFEDVLLRRALKDIRNGFYIDIGAQDPVSDSVSMGFYRLGWRGVHVEPVMAYADALRRERPDEIVIEAVVGEAAGDVSFHEFVGTGLSTVNAETASQHVRNGFRSKVRSVIGVRLAEILDAHRDRDIHWLKIDVEGQEASVIRSWQPSEVRPWIVVVESVDPFLHQDNSAAWDSELVALGYTLAHFDGLNRFYVSATHPELMGSLRVGPNLFDDFALSGTSSSPFCNVMKSQLQTLSVRETEARIQLAASISEVEHQRTELCGLRAELRRLAAEVQHRAVLVAQRESELRKLQLKTEEERSEGNEREAALRRQLTMQESKLSQLGSAIVDLSRTRETLTQEIALLRSSTSWKVTAPLRTLSRLAAFLKRGFTA